MSAWRCISNPPCQWSCRDACDCLVLRSIRRGNCFSTFCLWFVCWSAVLKKLPYVHISGYDTNSGQKTPPFHSIIANSESETHGSAETVACGNSSPVLTMLPLFIDDFANIDHYKNCSIWSCAEWTVWTQPPAMAIKPHRHLLIVTHLSHLSAWLIGLVLRASVCVCVVLLDDCCALWPFSQFLLLTPNHRHWRLKTYKSVQQDGWLTNGSLKPTHGERLMMDA